MTSQVLVSKERSQIELNRKAQDKSIIFKCLETNIKQSILAAANKCMEEQNLMTTIDLTIKEKPSIYKHHFAPLRYHSFTEEQLIYGIL